MPLVAAGGVGLIAVIWILARAMNGGKGGNDDNGLLPEYDPANNTFSKVYSISGYDHSVFVYDASDGAWTSYVIGNNEGTKFVTGGGGQTRTITKPDGKVYKNVQIWNDLATASSRLDSMFAATQGTPPSGSPPTAPSGPPPPTFPSGGSSSPFGGSSSVGTVGGAQYP